MNAFIIIYLGILAIGIMLWATVLIAGKKHEK
jgi:hypothetical protein